MKTTFRAIARAQAWVDVTARRRAPERATVAEEGLMRIWGEGSQKEQQDSLGFSVVPACFERQSWSKPARVELPLPVLGRANHPGTSLPSPLLHGPLESVT